MPHDRSAAQIAAVMRAVQGDLTRAWTVADMAAVVGVSGGQLRRICATRLGASPRQLLCNLRLQAAAVLLRNHSMRVKEIQTRVGIGDASHFCRDFRDRFGVSPTEYRYQNSQPTDSNDAAMQSRS